MRAEHLAKPGGLPSSDRATEGHRGAMPAISRGLSQAIPPVTRSRMDCTANAVPDARRIGEGQPAGMSFEAGTAARCISFRRFPGGVVAALLDLRLMAGNPPGCGKGATGLRSSSFGWSWPNDGPRHVHRRQAVIGCRRSFSAGVDRSHRGAMPAISRGLSAATPPVTWFKLGCTANAVPDAPAIAPDQSTILSSAAGTASRCFSSRRFSGGVVAALLNPRLMAGNPPGCIPQN